MPALLAWALALTSSSHDGQCARSASAVGTVMVTLSPAVIDFGALPRHATGEREVILRNTGPEPLALAGPDSDCTCLSSRTRDAMLRPGAETGWTIRLETCDYLGEVRRTVWVDAGGRRWSLPVRYRVVPEVHAEPDVLQLGLLSPDDRHGSFEIATAGDACFEVLAARCDDGQVEVQIERAAVTRAQPGRLRVTLHGPPAPGRFKALVWVETTSTEAPRLRVPVVGFFVPGLAADVTLVDFGEVPLGSGAERRVTLECAPDLRLGDFRSHCPGVEVDDLRQTEGRVYLKLAARPDLPLGRFWGEISFDAHGADHHHKVRLPLRGQVVEPPAAPNAARTAEAARARDGVR